MTIRIVVNSVYNVVSRDLCKNVCLRYVYVCDSRWQRELTRWLGEMSSR